MSAIILKFPQRPKRLFMYRATYQKNGKNYFYVFNSESPIPEMARREAKKVLKDAEVVFLPELVTVSTTEYIWE